MDEKESKPPYQRNGQGAGLARPNSAVYVPTHAASEFSTSIGQAKPLARQLSIQRPVTAAYMLKHAATDFSRLNVNPKINPNESGNSQIGRKALPLAHSVTVRSANFESDDESTNY